MKRKIANVLFALVFLAGFGIFAYPAVSDQWNAYRQNQLISTYDEVVARMEQLGMVVDVSHLNDPGFWDVARVARRPFIATHSDSRAVCGHSRNLTDDQFKAIRDAGGIVGINFCTMFLAPVEEFCVAAGIRVCITEDTSLRTLQGLTRIYTA